MTRSKAAGFLVGLLSVVWLTSSAQAVLILPGSSPVATGDQTSQTQIDVEIEAYFATVCDGIVAEVYKQNVGGGSDSGSSAGSYSTVFANSASDPEDATITYGSGPSISGDHIFALVKDGNSSPAWYLFDISGWNGTDVLQFQDFWPQQGAISHVALYVCDDIPGAGLETPEPATMAMWGFGIVGFGLVARRRRKLLAAA